MKGVDIRIDRANTPKEIQIASFVDIWKRKKKWMKALDEGFGWSIWMKALDEFSKVHLFKTVHTVSFDWFLSSLEWIINLELEN